MQRRSFYGVKDFILLERTFFVLFSPFRNRFSYLFKLNHTGFHFHRLLFLPPQRREVSSPLKRGFNLPLRKDFPIMSV